jgi:hypothetical protein
MKENLLEGLMGETGHACIGKVSHMEYSPNTEYRHIWETVRQHCNEPRHVGSLVR